MAEYFVIKREKCEKCDGKGWRESGDPQLPFRPCACSSGYIETQVPLLDVLKELQTFNGEYRVYPFLNAELAP